MARGWQFNSQDKHYVFPSRWFLRDDTSDFLSPTPLEIAAEWRMKVSLFNLSITWSIDPLFSASSSGTYSRSILLQRPLDPTYKERMLFAPGQYNDVVLNEPGPFYEPPFSVFHWKGESFRGGDDLFDETSLSATVRLFWDGWKTPDDGLDEGFVSPSIQLRVGLLYVGASEGMLRLQTSPTDWDLGIIPVPSSTILAAGEIDGISMGVIASDDQEESPYLLGGPEVVLTAVDFYPWAKGDGTEPMYDTATGLFLPGRDRYERSL